MFRFVVLFCLIQYVYGGCLVAPDANGHVSAERLSAALSSTTLGTTYLLNGFFTRAAENSAFHGCDTLKSVEIPTSVTTINIAAFYDTLNLQNITFLGNITTIEAGTYSYDGAFGRSGYYANTMSITFMGNVGTIGKYAFYMSGYNANSMSVDFRGNVGTIKNNAFYFSGYYANTMSIAFMGDVTTIEYNAFYVSGVVSVMYGGTKGSIASHAFQGTQYSYCRLDEPDPGMNLTTGHGTYGGSSDSFQNCKYLTSVTIEDDTVVIQPGAFYDTALTSVVIPESVARIGATWGTWGTFTYNPITELAILGTPTFNEHSSSSTYDKYRTFSRKPSGPLQLERYCFNYSALPEFIQNQLDISNAVYDCTFWCETGTGQISTNYNCTKPWSTSCDAGFYFTPKPTGMQVSMSDTTCTPCPSGQFQPKNNSDATSCTPTENGKRLVTAGTAVADAVWEDVPVASPSELNSTGYSLGCTGGETYQRGPGDCDENHICWDDGDVLECPSGAARLNETHCSSRKQDLTAALQSSCPL